MAEANNEALQMVSQDTTIGESDKQKDVGKGSGSREWKVEDFAKDIDYFHNVIGLPREGRSPKSLSATDVSAKKLEEHFGPKGGHNGYKKDGIKGIPAEDIQMLICAVDGIEKFQPYTQEVARGLYYERILKKKVNWAAFAVEKHKGQLRRRKIQEKESDLNVPPWKRVEHKYKPPTNLILDAEEAESCQSKGKPDPSSNVGVAEHVSLGGEAMEEGDTHKSDPAAFEPTPKPSVQEAVGNTEPHSIHGDQARLKVERLHPSTVLPCTGSGVPMEVDGDVNSMRNIMEEDLTKLGTKVEELKTTLAHWKQKLETISVHIHEANLRKKNAEAEQGVLVASVEQIQAELTARLQEKEQIADDLRFMEEPGDDGGLSDDENNEAIRKLRQRFVDCCSSCTQLEERLTVETEKRTPAVAELQLTATELLRLTKEEEEALDTTMKKESEVKESTVVQVALSEECSILKEHFGRGTVYVKPMSVVCPLQIEESYHPITECPICTLGFYCSNWVPTPCGHTYHPDCLFPLLRDDGSLAPRCVACSQIFHPGWLKCWGAPQMAHPDVALLVDSLGLNAQTETFKRSLSDLYKKNPLSLKARREMLALKHARVTKYFSKKTVEKSIEYHEAVSSANLVENRVSRLRTANQSCGTKGNGDSIDLTGTDDDSPARNSKFDPLKVKVETAGTSKRKSCLAVVGTSVVVDVSDCDEDTFKDGISQRRKRRDSGSSSLVQTSRTRNLRGVAGPMSPGLGLDADHGATDKIILKSIVNVKSPARGKGVRARGGAKRQL